MKLSLDITYQRRTLLLVAMCVLGAILSWKDLAQAKHVSIERWTPSNGMTVLLVERHALPTVHVEVLIKAGSIHDPQEKAGLANLTALLLDEGTASRSSTQIAEGIDFIGASLSSSADTDYTSVSLRVLKKDVRVGFDILSDILLRPTFPKEEVERKRQQVLGAITAQKDEPGIVAEKAFNRLLFGTHPYHRPVEGLEETIPQIQQEDITAFHQTYYRPNNTIMAVVGDITRQELEDLLRRYFKPWEKKKVQTLELPEPPRRAAPQLEVIDKDLTQANILLGHLGIERNNPDFYPLVVMN